MLLFNKFRIQISFSIIFFIYSKNKHTVEPGFDPLHDLQMNPSSFPGTFKTQSKLIHAMLSSQQQEVRAARACCVYSRSRGVTERVTEKTRESKERLNEGLSVYTCAQWPESRLVEDSALCIQGFDGLWVPKLT